jgi:thymidylate synthase
MEVTKILHQEDQYLDLIQKICTTGYDSEGRNGEVTRSIFGHTARWNLRNGTLPVITTKKVFLRGVIEELLWMVRGSTSVDELEERGIHIWDGHSTREHLDSAGLNHLRVGDIGAGYGHQWRHCGAPYEGCDQDYTGKGIDQLSQVIETLKTNPNSRRMVVCSWNPVDLPNMALPPCHCLFQFYRNDEGISCQLYQRSADVALGVPFNITSYALLTHMVAREVGVPAVEFIHVLGNAHIYKDHIKPLSEIQLQRRPYAFPKLRFKEGAKDIFSLCYDDFEIVDYKHHGSIKLQMVV